MKKKHLILIMAILCMAYSCKMGSHNQSITVVNNDKGYSFKAKYPKSKTNKVISFIEENLDDDKFYDNADGVKDEDVSLKDGSRFHLASEPGFVEINFIKKENSATNYQKLINVCMGIKEELN